MGRYYNGDIEGKFWFAVQSSDDADFFGVTGEAPRILEYYFGADNIPKVEDGLKECEAILGKDLQKLEAFFTDGKCYTDEGLQKETGIKNVREVLGWYARYNLGVKISNCLKKQGYCSFTVEC